MVQHGMPRILQKTLQLGFPWKHWLHGLPLLLLLVVLRLLLPGVEAASVLPLLLLVRLLTLLWVLLWVLLLLHVLAACIWSTQACKD